MTSMLSSQDLMFSDSPDGVAIADSLDMSFMDDCRPDANVPSTSWLDGNQQGYWQDAEEDAEIIILQQQMERLKGSNSILRSSITQVEQKVNIAIQEHMRLRNTITALRGYKEDLVILNPESKPGQSSEAEPFSKWLEEDPAEAFLTFDQELGAHAEEAKPGTSSGPHRKAQSIPAGYIALQDKQCRLPQKLELDPELATPAAVAAAALAFNEGNPAGAILDLVQLAISRAIAKERSKIDFTA